MKENGPKNAFEDIWFTGENVKKIRKYCIQHVPSSHWL